jgi:nucleotide sugar dehydrogenase
VSNSACIVGLGYVGLPLAVALAEEGVSVVGLDIDPLRVAALREGRSGIEDVPDEAVQQAHLSFASDPHHAADCTTYVICVPTPLRDGMPDLTAVEGAARTVASVLSSGDLVVLESTTYPGTTEEVVQPLLEAGSRLVAGQDFLLAYSPERIDPGNPTYGIRNTPKVVGGMDAPSTKAAVSFYGRIVETVVQVDGTREAEMAKLLENTFRHVNIALVNEMAVFCRELDIDLWQVIEAAKTKPFGFMPFYPGPGVGGHCIPVDPSYLSWRVRKLGFSFRFVELAQEINAQMPSYVVTRLADLLNDAGIALSRSKVLCLGAAYKPGVADCRESPSIEVMRRLEGKGAAVSYSDPFVAELALSKITLESIGLDTRTIAAFDAVVVLTAHAEFNWDLIGRHANIVLDTRAVVPSGIGVHRL